MSPTSDNRSQGPPTAGVYSEESPARPPTELLNGTAGGVVVASPAAVSPVGTKNEQRSNFFEPRPKSATPSAKHGGERNSDAASWPQRSSFIGQPPPADAMPSSSANASGSSTQSRLVQDSIGAKHGDGAEREASISMMADGIGGAGVGTAATGDLGARSEFETLDSIRKTVRELEVDFDLKHPEMPLSGRIIHVGHYIPFVIRPLAEMEFERQREERIAATANVAAMAAAARAKKAAKLAAKAEKRELEAQRELQRHLSQFGEVSRKSSFRASSRRTSFAAGFGMTGLEGQDFEARLRENQDRSRRKAGRRAWMMTEVVDDTSELSEEDRFTPVGSRRGSTWSMASGGSFSNVNQEPWKQWGGISDVNSPYCDSPPTAPPAPQWVLTPRRGHTALNSGIRSLCTTHKQTYIGWPGGLQFAVQAKNDARTEPSQTTAEERDEIEGLLAALDDASKWTSQEAAVAGAPLDPESNQPPVSRLPTPIMNGAEPINPTEQGRPAGKSLGAKGSGSGEEVHGIKYVPVWLDHNVAHGHYEGYCKTTLWPLFHYLLWQDVHAERRAWEDYSWDAYYAANEAFATKVADEYRPGDLLWVHDYHLLLVPLMLRKLVPDAHIGLFVHAPFPSSEVFRCLPKRKEILEGMLGADLACFQAFSYSRHFLSSCIRLLGSESSANSVESHNGHITNITYNPIGIDSAKIAKDSSSESVLPKIQAIREMYRGKKILIGRDKLDVVRGVVQKLQAFHKFLAEFPEWRNKVVLIQVTAPALNDSPKLERQVSELVSHINGEFGSLSFTPVHHYHQIIDRDEYFALLSVADLALITSVRDGMNTTSMEYIICQERFAKSPLILSEFTGTAGRMRSAIQVNPWNIFGVAKAIDYALRIPEAEKRAHHDQLYHQVVMHTSHTWAAGLVKQLLVRMISEHSAHFTPPLDRDEMLAKFHKAKKRLFFLDYDGTLTPIVKQPEMAVPSKQLLDALKILSEDPKNIIFIISGRDGAFLGKHLGHFKNIGFSAEHGGFLKMPGSDEWRNLTEELDMTWMKGVRGVFEYYTERTGGSFIEQKKSSVTWHYRGADPDFGSFQAKECQAHLENLGSHNKLPVEVLVGKKNLEVRPLAVNKGEIVKRLLYDNTDADFVFCAGDDKTDEDMFRTLYNLTPANLNQEAAGRHTASLSLSPLQAAAAAVNKVDVNVACKELPKDVPLMISPPAPLKGGAPTGPAKALELVRDAIYTTMIGPNNRKTLAEWHVDNVEKIIVSLSEMAGLSTPAQDPPSVDADEGADEQQQQQQQPQP